MGEREKTPLLDEEEKNEPLLAREDGGHNKSTASSSFNWHWHKYPLGVLVVLSAASLAVQFHATPSDSHSMRLLLDATSKHSFVLNNDQFILDGESVWLRSGAMHYFRVPPSQWKDRMLRMQAMGLNTLETYIAWNVHNPREDVYEFDGAKDVEAYLSLAQELGLHVILRPGPYICGEWDFGGFPAWLLNPKKNIQGAHHLRTYYPEYIAEVDKWFAVLLPKLEPFLVQNGGNVVMVQVENEYGSYGDVSRKPNDKKYLEHLVELLRRYLGKEVVLFTTDWDGYFSRGSFKGDIVYTVGDFGPGYDPAKAFNAMKDFNAPGKSPNFNGEFYPGWLVHWGESHANTSAQEIANTMITMLHLNASFSFYMIHGGTNFGFFSGANVDGTIYQPDITRYDYNAPLGEDGRHGYGSEGIDKFALIKKTFHDFFKDSVPFPDEPAFQEAAIYKAFQLSKAVTLRDALSTLTTKTLDNQVNVQRMEAYDQSFGFIHYSRQLDLSMCDATRSCKLSIDGVRDRATVLVNGQVQGIVYRNEPREVMLQCPQGHDVFQLEILVENMGRINYSKAMYDPKGIIGKGVFVNGQLLVNGWTVNTLPLEPQQIDQLKFAPVKSSINEPTFFRGQFTIPSSEIHNTFLKMEGWEKGVVWVNGNNLGRYWQSQKTQQALFVPSDFLRGGANEVVVLELEKSPADVAAMTLSFSDHPIFSE